MHKCKCKKSRQFNLFCVHTRRSRFYITVFLSSCISLPKNRFFFMQLYFGLCTINGSLFSWLKVPQAGFDVCSKPCGSNKACMSLFLLLPFPISTAFPPPGVSFMFTWQPYPPTGRRCDTLKHHPSSSRSNL